jgi:lantibiotic biosynthesis protein
MCGGADPVRDVPFAFSASELRPGPGRLPWGAVVPPELAARAVTVASNVAQRLRDRRDVEAAYSAAVRQAAFPEVVCWQPASLAQGDAGLALACAYLDSCFSGAGWDRIGHGYLTGAAEDAGRHPYMPIGMWSGLAGLGLAAWSLCRDATRYQRLLTSVDEALLPRVAGQAGRLAGLEHGMSPGEFDAISGLAGVGAYLLCRREGDAAGAALDIALRALVSLVAGADARPRWWTPPDLMGSGAMTAQYPYGNLNCGLAHGIPGPLATMSLALLCDVSVPGLSEAVDRAASWLAGHRADDSWGVNWPVAVSLTANRAVAAVRPGCAGQPSRSAWCYGAPGVARVLWLAGLALDRPGWRDLAVEAMRAVYRRPVPARLIDSPTFCHGVSGLLQVTLRFANDTGLRVFADAAAALTEQLLGLYEPGSLAGYRSIEPDGGRVDSPGLLDGAPGVAVTLLAAATDAEPAWDRAFLLA